MKFQIITAFIAGIALAFGFSFQPWYSSLAIMVLAAVCVFAMLYLADTKDKSFQDMREVLRQKEFLVGTQDIVIEDQKGLLDKKNQLLEGKGFRIIQLYFDLIRQTGLLRQALLRAERLGKLITTLEAKLGKSRVSAFNVWERGNRLGRQNEKLKGKLSSCKADLAQLEGKQENLKAINSDYTDKIIAGHYREVDLERSLEEAYKSKIRVVRVPWHSGSRPSRTKKKGNQNKKRGRNSRFINRNRR